MSNFASLKFSLKESSDHIFSKIILTIQKKSESHHKEMVFETPFFISEGDWDYERQRPKNIYCKKYKELNFLLNEIKIEIQKLIQYYTRHHKNFPQKKFSSHIENISKSKIYSYEKESLLYLASMYIEQKKSSIQLSTYRRYIVFIRLLQNFEGHLMKRLTLQDVNAELVKKFQHFGVLEKYTQSTVIRTLHFVKTIINFSERNGYQIPVRNLDIPKITARKRLSILSEQEIVKIKRVKLPQEFENARDWLVISCYTGQRISDFMKFNLDQVLMIDGKACISFIQQKTGKEMLIPLHPIVLKIIKKNGGVFPKPIDVTHYNSFIKNIARAAGINNTINIRKRSGYRSYETITEKWETMSSHIGRRSFASNFYGKIPTPLLMQATGHSSEKMFLHYINPLNHERVLSLGNYFEKIYEERLL
ncbi:phage integrase SAM-like domain-containing protein [Chryseobacterium sp. IT-36CA2]|uniref:phage integrase SAM-like domain-containing protein n=1 Tax=Chryseobacterium sp. IT-36CA2 TaxID=3026460 RepID=UPI0039E08F4D